MLLLTILASLATGTIATPFVTPKMSSTIKLSTYIKVSAPTKTVSSIKFASLTNTKPKKSPIAPLLAVLSTRRTNIPNKRSSPPIKPISSVVRNRLMPPAAQMVAVVHNSHNRRNLPKNEPHVASVITEPDKRLKTLAYDYDEPEDLKNLPFSNNTQQGKPQNQPSNKILSEIKEKLQQGNDDYVYKLSEHRRANIEITKPNIVNLRYEYPNQVMDLNKKENYTLKTENTSNRNNMIARDSSERSFLNANRYLRRSGVTTPSPYEIKPYRKHRPHKRRKHGENLRRKHHRHGHKVHNRHIKRRHEIGLNTKDNVVTKALGIISERTETTTPTKKDQIGQSIIAKLSTTLRPYSHDRSSTKPSVATRPTEYEVSTSSTTLEVTLPFWKPNAETKASSLAFRAHKERHDRKDSDKSYVHQRPGPSLTTPSVFEIKSEKKQKKLEKFVKFINKNRVLLREFIAKKKSNKAAERVGKGYFRGGRESVQLQANQLDLSPAKGNKIEALRAKGRVCQRNLMIPEGPKYNSMGCTYMPEFKKAVGHPDYPATKMKRFLIPACCNCCKKSVLGCE